MRQAVDHEPAAHAELAATMQRPIRVSVQLAIALMALCAWTPGLSAQNVGVTVDAIAKEFSKIAASPDTMSAATRAHWLFTTFEATRVFPGRDQPQDTIIDSFGDRAIFTPLRPGWDVDRWTRALEAIRSIDRARLNARDALSYDIVSSDVSRALALAQAPDLYMPVSDQRGLHLIIWYYGSEFIPSKTVEDYELLLAHLSGVAAEIDEMMQGMRRANAAGVMPPRLVMTKVADALRPAIVEDPMASGYLAKFSKFPASISPRDQERLRANAVRIYTLKIRPAYQRLLKYAVERYIPAATESIGLSALPGGAERYATLVRLRAKPRDLSPGQMHQMALDDVARHAAAIDSLRAVSGYKGSYREFLDFLRTDSRFEFPDSATYVRAAREIAKRVDANILRLFKTVPRLPFGVEGLRGVGGGFYRGGSFEDHRPGMVMLFVASDRPGPSWRLPSLMLHEGVPGHHFSHALILEQNLRQFQRQGSFTAFTEGWGMYAESMGAELGVYDDDYAKVGQLAGSLWRACRAVLDAGVHGLGWTERQAINWALENSPQSEAQIKSELRGIITNPGSVLAYKLGQWKFLELRALAERDLGAGFDVRVFNDALTENGEMPMDVLDTHIRAWVAHRVAARH